MTSNEPKNQKHAPLARPTLGSFGKTEMAIIGTPCGVIQEMARKATQALSSIAQIAYVDADHKSADEAAATNAQSILGAGAAIEFTDKITHSQIAYGSPFNPYECKLVFRQADLVLVNGNHFEAQQQIVVLDPKKLESLQRKTQRLTHVRLFIQTPEIVEIPEFVKESVPHWQAIPVISSENHNAFVDFLKQAIEAATPPLKGLVLAGGKSLRMGQDKGLLHYHGKPQRDVVASLIAPLCEEVYSSCRPEQAQTLKNPLPDMFLDLGPLGAILSAFRAEPDTAWLVVACDLPLLTQNTLQYLVQNRHPAAIATAFKGDNPQGFPEPLIAIWEPKSYARALQFLAAGYVCPRKVLINSQCHLLTPPNPHELANANTPEEAEAILSRLSK